MQQSQDSEEAFMNERQTKEAAIGKHMKHTHRIFVTCFIHIRIFISYVTFWSLKARLQINDLNYSFTFLTIKVETLDAVDMYSCIFLAGPNSTRNKTQKKIIDMYILWIFISHCEKIFFPVSQTKNNRLHFPLPFHQMMF